jgi:hypothetical protein
VSIPAAALVEQMAVHRAPVPVYAARSQLAHSYEQLWAAVSATCIPTSAEAS